MATMSTVTICSIPNFQSETFVQPNGARVVTIYHCAARTGPKDRNPEEIQALTCKVVADAA